MFTHCVIKIISKKGLNLNSDALNTMSIGLFHLKKMFQYSKNGSFIVKFIFWTDIEFCVCVCMGGGGDISIYGLVNYFRFNINVLTTWTESTVSLSRRGRLLKYARSGGICLHKPRKRRRSFGEIGPRREVDQPPPQSTQVISVRRFANDVQLIFVKDLQTSYYHQLNKIKI